MDLNYAMEKKKICKIVKQKLIFYVILKLTTKIKINNYKGKINNYKGKNK